MSTRSSITIKRSKKDIETAYCHFDDEVLYTGQILHRFY